MHIDLKLNMPFYNGVKFHDSAIQASFKVRVSFTLFIPIY